MLRSDEHYELLEKGERYDDLMTEKTLAQQAYDDLYRQYIYIYGVLAILVEQEGGLVEIPRELLESYDLTTPMQLRHVEENDTFVIEVQPKDA